MISTLFFPIQFFLDPPYAHFQLHSLKKNNPPNPISAVHMRMGTCYPLEHGQPTKSHTLKKTDLPFASNH